MRYKTNGSTLETEEVRQTCRLGLGNQGKVSVSLSLSEGKSVNPVITPQASLDPEGQEVNS